ncbi:TRAP transporter substrate-binding protein [Thermodesulfobacteriota bacterium]
MMRKKKLITVILVGVIFAITMLVSTYALASEEVIKLRFATPYSLKHPMTVADLRFIEKIEKETKGRVKITMFPGGVLMKSRATWGGMAKGVADLGVAAASYEKTGFDLFKGYRLFSYGMPSWQVSRKVHDKLWATFPEIPAQYAKNKMLAKSFLNPYHLFTSKKAVKNIEGFKGLQLKAVPEFVAPLKQLGAVGMVVPMSEVYIALQKNTVDGMLGPYETLKSFKLAEVVKYVTRINITRGHYSNRAMNWDTWKRLPPDVQKIIEENGDWWGREIDMELEKTDEIALGMAKKLGVQFFDLTPGDLAKFYKAIESEALKKAKALDAAGMPGTKVFKEVRRLIKEYSK